MKDRKYYFSANILKAKLQWHDLSAIQLLTLFKITAISVKMLEDSW